MDSYETELNNTHKILLRVAKTQNFYKLQFINYIMARRISDKTVPIVPLHSASSVGMNCN